MSKKPNAARLGAAFALALAICPIGAQAQEAKDHRDLARVVDHASGLEDQFWEQLWLKRYRAPDALSPPVAAIEEIELVETPDAMLERWHYDAYEWLQGEIGDAVAAWRDTGLRSASRGLRLPGSEADPSQCPWFPAGQGCCRHFCLMTAGRTPTRSQTAPFSLARVFCRSAAARTNFWPYWPTK